VKRTASVPDPRKHSMSEAPSAPQALKPAPRAALKRAMDFVWPLLGLLAVIWSVRLLYIKLQAEVASDPKVKQLLDGGGLWSDLKVIASVIADKLVAIPAEAYGFAILSTLFAYAALAWYDRIALIHLNKTRGISWLYISVCSFVTYALAHNIGASVLSGGMVRLRAYTAKGLSAGEVAILVAMCSFTFAFGTLILTGLVLAWDPSIVTPLAEHFPKLDVEPWAVRAVGLVMLAFCAAYTVGAWLQFKPAKFGSLEVVYPRMKVVALQYVAAPLELIGAAGIIYFALPELGNPGFFVVLGAFLLSFSAGLLSQVPGGVGVMEAVFLAMMPSMPASSVVAALLVWRLLYLLLPLALSVPVVLLFERAQVAKNLADSK
jgi:glycosyltransferase 2 family protein